MGCQHRAFASRPSRACAKKLSARLQSSLTLHSFHRSLSRPVRVSPKSGDTPHTGLPIPAGVSFDARATTNIDVDDVQDAQSPGGIVADDVSTSASSSDAPDGPMQPLGRFKKMI